jgi:hypothetical protein
MRDKLLAYTISELLVVLVISGLVIAFISQSFFLVSKFQAKLTDKFYESGDFERLNWLINADFEKSEFLNKEGNKVICLIDDRLVTYDFSNQFLVRTQNEVSERFPFEIISVEYKLLENINSSLVQGVFINYKYGGSNIRVPVWKHYDTVSLIYASSFIK